MPELPEVETIRGDLEPLLVGTTTVDVDILWEGSIARPTPQEFRATVVGREVLRLGRRGKYLIFDLSGGWSLLVHLGMTGRLLVKESPAEVDRHTRVIFHLHDGRWLRFVDMRKFGRLHLVREVQKVVGGLGPEPLATDFTPQGFARLLARRRGMIKPLLLNQRFLAGLGNIYADEALFVARLHPRRGAGTLSPEEVERLHGAIRSVLEKAIQDRGTTLEDETYVRPSEEKGRHQERLQVFQRRGGACPRCGTAIERIVLGGRGTYFCPLCQR